MSQVTFVILHYLLLDVTLKCIKSIQDNIVYPNYKIVIVDNGSDNKSGEKLVDFYKDDKNIEVICLDNNLGFSAGNNIGYSYAREHFRSEYIIIMNNDTEVIQSDFIQKAINCFEEEKYYVLGPDIVNLDGIHQSPQRDHVITRLEAWRWYIKRYLFSKYLHLHKWLGLSENFFVLRVYLEHDEKRKKNFNTDKKQVNIELQGACFIFSPLFIANNSFAFEELTFMYGEEALLSLRCSRNQWKMFYNPELKIKHVEKASTSIINKGILNKEIFWSDKHVQAIKIILKKFKGN